AVVRRPTALEAALSLDHKFGLRERITTSVSLNAAERESSAGMALLADGEQHVAKLEVKSGYPFAPRWSAGGVPICAALLVCPALLYHPAEGNATPIDSDEKPLANAANIEKEIKKLEKKPREQKKGTQPASEAIQQFDEDLDKLTVKPRDTRKQAQNLV